MPIFDMGKKNEHDREHRGIGFTAVGIGFIGDVDLWLSSFRKRIAEIGELPLDAAVRDELVELLERSALELRDRRYDDRAD